MSIVSVPKYLFSKNPYEKFCGVQAILWQGVVYVVVSNMLFPASNPQRMFAASVSFQPVTKSNVPTR
jgi:hypothetical protein